MALNVGSHPPQLIVVLNRHQELLERVPYPLSAGSACVLPLHTKCNQSVLDLAPSPYNRL